jgi:glutathione synthase/RimK-type ligase-like ATP-grasp enzyme
MILILTDKNDSHSRHLEKIIQDREIPYYKFCVDVESLKNTVVTYKDSWEITQYGNYLDFKAIKCVWCRRTFVELLLEEEYDQSNDFKIWKNEWNKTLIGVYNSLKTLPWMNQWRNAYRAENKYFQMEVARNVGLKIPDTIISNKKEELLQFAATHDDIVLKLMNQDFYKSDTNQYLGFYVNKISFEELKRFGDSNENPIVLQKYIEKDYEVRYTVVGSSHFVCKIESQKSQIANVDWRRYDIPNTPHSTINPPDNIKSSVSELMKVLELEYGALDFIVTHDGEWLFLEINSMGQFLWIEELSGLSISDEIISWLKKYL